MLASSQAEVALVAPDSSKTGKKDKIDDDDDQTPPIAPIGGIKTLLTIPDMLLQLSTHFNKPHSSHKTRVGIFDFYAALLALLGTTFVESNYAIVVHHFINEIIMNGRNLTTRYEVLLVRRLVGILLRDLIGVRLLSEQAQIEAIQELSSTLLKRWPALMPGHKAPTSHVLAISLREVAGLLQQLGNAPPPVQVSFKN